jgi:hypothetical protein
VNKKYGCNIINSLVKWGTESNEMLTEGSGVKFGSKKVFYLGSVSDTDPKMLRIKKLIPTKTRSKFWGFDGTEMCTTALFVTSVADQDTNIFPSRIWI